MRVESTPEVSHLVAPDHHSIFNCTPFAANEIVCDYESMSDDSAPEASQLVAPDHHSISDDSTS